MSRCRYAAASIRGNPVYFELIGPWTRPERMQPYQPPPGERAFLVTAIVLFFVMLVGSALLVRQNLRLGRGDRRGAFRVAAFVYAAWVLAWLFGAHHVPDFGEFLLFMEVFLTGLAWSGLVWVLYIALEPYVRRRWPATLVSWSRLLAGGFRDPLVGRDMLIGCFSAATTTAIGRLLWFIPFWLGHLPPQPESGPEWQFLGARTIIAAIASLVLGAPILWLAVFSGAGTQFHPEALAGILIFCVVAAFLLIRFGLLTLVAHDVVWVVLTTFPLTTQGSAW
jgi:hypothetical protein